MDQHSLGVFSGERETGAEVFWGEIAPCEHLVQIYEDDALFLDALEGFVTGGLRKGDAVVVIATEPHRHGLEDRLRMNGIDWSAPWLSISIFRLTPKRHSRGSSRTAGHRTINFEKW